MVKREMVHDTATRWEAKCQKKRAQELVWESRTQEGIDEQFFWLMERARELQDKARLEDLTI
jgi:hypothetical protein